MSQAYKFVGLSTPSISWILKCCAKTILCAYIQSRKSPINKGAPPLTLTWTRTMPALEQLPYEIFAEILSYLPCSDLARTCLISRHLHSVSQPVLYRAPSLTCGQRANPPSLQILLRTLLSPGGEKLATHVRSLRLKWEKIDREPTPENQSDIALMTAAASRFGLHQSVTSQDTQVVLLLHLLPRLQAFDPSPPPDSYSNAYYDSHSDSSPDHFTEFMEAHHTDTPLALQPLREFSCASNPTDRGISFKTLLTVLKLPHIRRIDVRLIDQPIFAANTTAVANTSAVKILHLKNTIISPLSLEYILKTPTGLTRLSLSPISRNPDFEIEPFGPAIRAVRATLQHLHLDFSRVAEPQHWRTTKTLSTIGSFRDWPALHTIRCSLMLLLGRGLRADTPALADILPAGLRELEILRERYWAVAEEADQVVELLARKEAMVPVLEKLAMQMATGRVMRSQDALRGACVGAAVALVNTSLSPEMRRRGVRRAESTGRGLRVKWSCCRRI